jgi:geranylgeranyl diphosphate synthase type II
MNHYLELIEKQIKNYPFPNEPKALYQPASYLMELGGKRMRPLLLLLSGKMFGAEIHKILPQALAFEFFHNFTLAHDDIMDNAPLRRGKPTLHEKWNLNTALLSGDVLIIEAYKLLAQCEHHILPDLLNLFNQTAVEVCEGQQLDIDFENTQTVTEEAYIKMITLKTAVLPAAALKSGAMLANAPQQQAQLIYEFGIYLGIAFQIMDDYLDAYGNAQKFGKQTGGDILSNKKTCLYIYALNNLPEPDKQTLCKLYNSNHIDNKVELVLSLFEKAQVSKYIKDIINNYYQSSLNCLKQINVPEENKKELYQLAENLLNREN